MDWRNKRTERRPSVASAAADDDEENRSSIVSNDDDQQRMNPDEALGHALLKLTTLMVREQNFLIDFFGIIKGSVPVVSSTISENFPAIDENADVSSWQLNLGLPRQQFKDPKAEKRIM